MKKLIHWDFIGNRLDFIVCSVINFFAWLVMIGGACALSWYIVNLPAH